MTARLPAPRRKRQLLDVALERFAENGFHGTSMDDIAEAAGVTKPVLYQHFGSKRALFLELLDDVGGQLMQAIATATARAGSPRRQVEAGFAAYATFVVQRESAFRLLFGGGERRDDEFAEITRQVEDTIADAIATLIDADIDDDHRRVLSRAIVGMAEGVARDRLRRHAGPSPEVLARELADLAWAGLRGVRRV